jgi:hypothetical protein
MAFFLVCATSFILLPGVALCHVTNFTSRRFKEFTSFTVLQDVAVGIHKIAMQLLVGPARSTYVEAVDKAFMKEHNRLCNEAVAKHISDYKDAHGGENPSNGSCWTVRNTSGKL